MTVPPFALRLPGEWPTPHLLLQLRSLRGPKTSAPALEEVQGEALEEERKKAEKKTWKKKFGDGINWIELWLLVEQLSFLQWTAKADDNYKHDLTQLTDTLYADK